MKGKIEDLKKKFDKQSFWVGVLLGVIFFTASFLAIRFGVGGSALSGAIGFVGGSKVSEGEASEIMQELVKNNLTKSGTEVEVLGVEYKKEIGLYEVDMKLGGKAETTAYLSKDGEYFIKEASSVEEIKRKRIQQEEAALKEAERRRNIEVPKSEKPEVEVFVMSYCPFGTQVQKGFLPVIKTLGNKADIKFKFVDYLMHGKKELDENLNQYCIEQKADKKYLSYLECFLGSEGSADDSKRCMKDIGISSSVIEECVASTDKKLDATAKLDDKTRRYPVFNLHKEGNDKYDVKGSPAIVINGTTVEPNRDPSSLLETVCKGFESAPKECEAELAKQVPAPGFGVGSATSDGGGCAE